jgi:predicted phage tail protein
VTAPMGLCQTSAGANFLTGTFYEAGVWPGAISRTSMSTNMTNYY